MKFWMIIFLCLSITIASSAQKYEKRQQALKVLENSINYLSCEDCWNRADDRHCEDDFGNKQYSLYCALYQSQLDINGKYRHRGFVMKTIRKVLRSRTSKRYPHIIRDYNNLDSTSLNDIKEVIEASINLIRE